MQHAADVGNTIVNRDRDAGTERIRDERLLRIVAHRTIGNADDLSAHLFLRSCRGTPLAGFR